jgi:CheY-like chemotaxis protein
MARVLIVDDSEEDRLLHRTALEDAGHDLFFAKNGGEAMKAYLANDIDVVVTDLEMPDGNGFELITGLLGMDEDTRIITISGSSPEELDMAKLLGALLTLAKPVAPNELIEAVAEITASS